jgi:hypothetical protein
LLPVRRIVVDFQLGEIEIGVPRAEVGNQGFYLFTVTAAIAIEINGRDGDV